MAHVALAHHRRDGQPVRVRLEAATLIDEAALAPTFTSNLDYFRSAGEVAGDARSALDSLVRGYLDEELMRPDGRCPGRG